MMKYLAFAVALLATPALAAGTVVSEFQYVGTPPYAAMHFKRVLPWDEREWVGLTRPEGKVVYSSGMTPIQALPLLGKVK